MTALCPGGGPSEPQVGVGPVITLTSVAVGAFLTALIDPVAADLIAGVVAASLQLDVGNYCANDPPADPGLTSNDLLALANFADSASHYAAVTKTVQWFEARYWYQICQCTGGGTPAPPTVSNPGPVTQNPGLPGQGPGECWNVTVPYSVAAAPSPNAAGTDLGNAGLPHQTSATQTITFSSSVTPSTVTGYPAVAGSTNYRLGITADNAISSGQLVEVYCSFWNSALTQLGPPLQVAIGPTRPANDPYPTIAAINPSAAWCTLVVTNTDSVTHTGTVTLSLYCANGSQELAQPCCPPDPTLETLINQVLALENLILASLPTQINSYADSTVHTGLSGTGTIVLSTGTIGVRAHFTAIPPSFGGTMGSPPQWYGAGELVASASTYPLQTFRVQYDDQVFALPSLTTELDYTLPVGVTLTVTELVRGP